MEVPQRQFVLRMLKAMNDAGGWCGETHLQKCVFLYSILEEEDSPFDFSIYKHGPYSFDLHDLISQLEAGFLISRTATSPYGSRLEVTRLGQRVLELSDRELSCCNGVEDIAKRFSVRTVADLERIGTAAFLNDKFDDWDLEDKMQRLTEIKPHIDREAARASFSELEDLDRNRGVARVVHQEPAPW